MGAAMLTLAAPACASMPSDYEAMAQYIRAQLAQDADQPAAAAAYAALLTADPADTAMALRAYRGGMEAGDQALAVRAARILDAQGALPAEGRLLLLADLLNRKDWRGAGLAIDRLEAERNFEFVSPILRAWVSYGAHESNPALLLDHRPTSGLTSAYAGDHRALLLIASGKQDEGVAILQSLTTANQGLSYAGVRIAAASMLAGKRARDAALTVLTGNDPAITAAQKLVRDKGRLNGKADGASKGISLLIVRLAEDVGGREPNALSVSLARIATFLDPKSDAAWAVTASILRDRGNLTGAQAAVARIDPKGPWRSEAIDTEVALLAAGGDEAAALMLAEKAANAPGANAGDFSRLGDLFAAASRPGDAAEAYHKAIARTEADGGVSDWSIWLLLGSALKQAGDWEGAKPALEKALALSPDQPVVLNYLGYAQLERRENLAEAEALIKRANKINPDDPSFIDSLGWAYHVRGDKKRAVEMLELAMNAMPAESIINEHLGDAYWAAGRKIEARYAWQSALVTADDDATIRLKPKIDLGWTAATAAP